MSKREYEYRFKNIDLKKIRNMIRKNRGRQVLPKTLMPIIVFHHPQNKKDLYIRVRHEGDKITFTIKTDLRNEFPIEREVEINNMKEMIDMLKLLGFRIRYRVEKLREIWIIKGAKEIVFDSYPGLPTYMEIDAHSKNDLERITKLLGLKSKKRWLGGDMYGEYYGLPKKRRKGDLTFKNANKVIGKYVRKNKKLFNLTLSLQKKYIKKNINKNEDKVLEETIQAHIDDNFVFKTLQMKLLQRLLKYAERMNHMDLLSKITEIVYKTDSIGEGWLYHKGEEGNHEKELEEIRAGCLTSKGETGWGGSYYAMIVLPIYRHILKKYKKFKIKRKRGVKIKLSKEELKEIMNKMKKDDDTELVYEIVKILAENDSIAEGWRYKLQYGMSDFRREKEMIYGDGGYLSVGLSIYKILMDNKS